MFTREESFTKFYIGIENRAETFWINPCGAYTIPFNYDVDGSHIPTPFPFLEGTVLLTDAQDYEKKEVCGQLPQNAFQVFLSVGVAFFHKSCSPEAFKIIIKDVFFKNLINGKGKT